MAVEEIRIIGRADMQELDKALEIAGLKLSTFNRYMKTNFLQMDKNKQITSKLTGQMQSYGQVVGQAAIKSRRFKFEWLSIMFAGMALNRAFGGLVKTQMQLFGVTDMLSSAWTVVLLPVIEAITPFLYALLDIFMNLSPEMKIAVGVFVLMAAGIGGILLVIGQLALAIGGIALLFHISFAAAAAAVAAVVIIIMGIGLVIGGITTIIKNWGKDWGAVVKGISYVLAGLALIIIGIAILIGSWPLAFIAVGIAIIAAIIWLVSKIIKNWDKIKEFFAKVWQKIKDIFFGAWDWIKKKTWGFIKWYLDLPKKIWEAFKGLGKRIKNAIMDIIPNWIISLLKGGGKLLGKIGIKGFQAGGLVTQTGPAILHRGERVIPKGRITGEVIFSPTIMMYPTINNEMDIRVLADKLNRFWASDFERLMQGRGSY